MVWLVGRAVERRALEERWRHAGTGAAEILVLVAPAGVGKSSLLRDFRQRHRTACVQARGFASEEPEPYAAVRDLRRELALRRQVTAVSAPPRPGDVVPDPHGVGAELLHLLDEASRDAPLAVLLDDFHAFDPSSQRAIAFAVRRLVDEPILVLIGTRPSAEAGALLAELPTWKLDPLDHDAAVAVVRRSAPSPLDRAVEERLVDLADGNPLALTQLPVLLDDDQRAGQSVLPPSLPLPEALAAVFEPAIDALTDDARRALCLVALAVDGELDIIRYVLGAATDDAVSDLHASGLIAGDGTRVVLDHPLIGPAVLDALDVAARRRLLGALAEAYASTPDVALTYEAAAAVGPDADLAGKLEDLALRRRRGGAPLEAAAAATRAAELHEDTCRRDRARLLAAQCAAAGGAPSTARVLLESILDGHPDPDLADEATVVLALEECLGGNPTGAFQRLQVAVEAARAEGRHGAGDLSAAMALPLGALGLTREIVRVTDEALGLVPSTDPGWCLIAATAAHGRAAVRSGSGAELVDRAIAALDVDVVLAAPDPTFPLHVGRTLAMGERYDDALAVLDQLVRDARAAGPSGMLTLALGTLGEVAFRRCDWSRAEAALDEALDLGEAIGHTTFATFWHAVRSRLRAACGDVDGGRHDLDVGLARAGEFGLLGAGYFLHASRGLLALGQGDLDEAVEALEVCLAFEQLGGELAPNLSRWRPELVEAYWSAGRGTEAASVLAPLRDAATSPGVDRWTVGVWHRCEALLSEPADPAGRVHAVRAVEALDPVTDRFDHARALVLLAAGVRVDGDADGAVELLRRARSAFGVLGAAPWRERAERELRSLGSRPEAVEQSVSALLTPVEHRVLTVVAEGSTNDEVARTLFLSPKTVANHLTRIYRKLGVSSRVEAVRCLLDDGVRVRGE